MSTKIYQALLVQVTPNHKSALAYLKQKTGTPYNRLVQEAIDDLMSKRQRDSAEPINGGQQPVVELPIEVRHPFEERANVPGTANIVQASVPVQRPRIATTSFTTWIRDNRAGPQDYENIKRCLTGSRASCGRFSAESKRGTRDTEIRIWDHTSKSSELHLKNGNAISKFLITLPELLKDAQNEQQGSDGVVLF